MSLKKFSNEPPTEEIPLGASIAISGVIDGITGMIREGVYGFEDFRSGKITESELIDRVYDKGVFSGSRTAGALSLREAFKLAGKKLGNETLKRITRSHAMTSVAFGLVDQGIDTYKYKTGSIDDRQYKVSTVKNVGTTSGSIGGIAVGSMIGSAVPVVGTLVGGMLGGMIGGMYGGQGGQNLGEAIFGKDPNESDDATPKGPYITVEIE